MIVIEFSLVLLVGIVVADVDLGLGELQLPEAADVVGEVVDLVGIVGAVSAIELVQLRLALVAVGVVRVVIFQHVQLRIGSTRLGFGLKRLAARSRRSP